MSNDNDDTAVQASIEDVSGSADRVDAQVREVLGRVMAQRHSAETAFAYVAGLSPGVKANCRALAEAAGHQSPYRMQALPGCYRWDWADLRAELPALARAWLPCDEDDLTGPGLAIDETAQLKDGDVTACVAPQHAGCTGHADNCVTTVFSAWVTTSGQAWADFDVFMPGRWDKDWPRRRAARIPGGLERKTKPQLAIAQIGRLLDAGLPAKRAAYDEVHGRSGELRRFCQSRGLTYVAVIPRDFRITLPSGAVIRADQAVKDAVFERRSCGPGSKGPRLADPHRRPQAHRRRDRPPDPPRPPVQPQAASPAPASPSACAGPGGGAATRPAPGGTTTPPGWPPQPAPDPRRPEGGDRT